MAGIRIRIRDPKTNGITAVDRVFASIEEARVHARTVAPLGSGVEFTDADTGEVKLIASPLAGGWNILYLPPKK